MKRKDTARSDLQGYESDRLGEMSDRVAGRIADRIGDEGDRYDKIMSEKEEDRIAKIVNTHEWIGEPESKKPKPPPPKPNCTNYTAASPPPPTMKVDPETLLLPRCLDPLTGLPFKMPAAAAKITTNVDG